MAGCPVDQIRNFFKAQVFLQPKQLEMSAAARACDYRCPSCKDLIAAGQSIPEDCPDCGPTSVGVGGARGGAKSNWMLSQVCTDDCQRFPGLKFLYVRVTAKSLREQVRGLLPTVCSRLPGSYNYREQGGTIEFPNGSHIVVGNFKDEKTIKDYLVQEYDGIACDELT